jgi:hypothetical protein
MKHELIQMKKQGIKTRVEEEAKRLVAAKNQKADTPQFNQAMAEVYTSASSLNLHSHFVKVSLRC